jgi:gamma-glutamyltranspeptidase/glutathione hydrolase
LVEILNILAARPEYPQLPAGSAASLHLLAEAMRLAFADRMAIGDPDFVTVPLKRLLSPAYAAHLATSIDPHKATPSSAVKPGQPQQYEHPSTTHLSVVDAAGNAVSTTQTVNYSFGSGVVAAGTGIVLNDEMDDFAKKVGAPNVFGVVGSNANAIAPGKTMVSSMSPTLVFAPNGALRLVLGSPGGPRIINATVQTILHVIDHHMSLGDAVQSARIHQQWMPDLLYVEKDGIAPGVASELVGMGYKIAIGDGIGDVQAIGIEAGGILTGASDTRAEGAPLGY